MTYNSMLHLYPLVNIPKYPFLSCLKCYKTKELFRSIIQFNKQKVISNSNSILQFISTSLQFHSQQWSNKLCQNSKRRLLNPLISSERKSMPELRYHSQIIHLNLLHHSYNGFTLIIFRWKLFYLIICLLVILRSFT